MKGRRRRRALEYQTQMLRNLAIFGLRSELLRPSENFFHAARCLSDVRSASADGLLMMMGQASIGKGNGKSHAQPEIGHFSMKNPMKKSNRVKN